jgi:hypothetical protein
MSPRAAASTERQRLDLGGIECDSTMVIAV